MAKYPYIIIFWLALLVSTKSMAQHNGTNGGNGDAAIERISILLPGEDIGQRIKENMFVRVETSKKVCVVGEPLLVTYKLFTRLQSHSKVVDAPTFTGCSVVEMTTNDQKEEEETLNGKVFRTYVIRKVQLFPLQEGPLQLGKATLDNDVTFYSLTRGVYKTITQKLQLANDSVTVKVNSLPHDSLQHAFTGVVGKFLIYAKVAKTTDTANDNNTIELKIMGTGNFMNMVCPTIEWPVSVTGFEPQGSEMLDKLSFPVMGEKKYIIPFTCTKVGETVIPPITFRYFDGDSQKYVSIKTDSLSITVRPAIPLIDPSKLSPAITNIKYLWIIPAIAAMVGLVFMYYSIKKKKAAIVNVQQSTEENTIDNEGMIDYNEKLSVLLSIEDNKTFYAEAKILASTIKEYPLSELESIALNNIISLCNEAIYAPIEANREHIVTTLQQIISIRHPF